MWKCPSPKALLSSSGEIWRRMGSPKRKSLAGAPGLPCTRCGTTAWEAQGNSTRESSRSPVAGRVTTCGWTGKSPPMPGSRKGKRWRSWRTGTQRESAGTTPPPFGRESSACLRVPSNNSGEGTPGSLSGTRTKGAIGSPDPTGRRGSVGPGAGEGGGRCALPAPPPYFQPGREGAGHLIHAGFPHELADTASPPK